MTFTKAILVLIVSMASQTGAWSQVSIGNAADTQICDMLASDPIDQERPAYSDRIPVRINDPEDAIKRCAAAVAKSPENLRLRHNLARAYSQSGSHDIALANFGEAARAGYAASMLALAEYLLSDADQTRRAEGRSWLSKAREHWYPAANYAYAQELERGRGGPQDLTQARVEYAGAADGGVTEALMDLGRMHGLGLGGNRDGAKAREYYRRAASRGNVVAMNNLGHVLWYGEGGTADPQEARGLIERAAAAGYSPAINNLGVMLWKGVGGSKDPAQALRVFQDVAGRYPVAWANMAAVHLSGDLGEPSVDNAILAYVGAAKAGVSLETHLLSWLDSTNRRDETALACMLIALTLVQDHAGSKIVNRIVLNGDGFVNDVQKVLGKITAPDISRDLQQHSELLKLKELPRR